MILPTGNIVIYFTRIYLFSSIPNNIIDIDLFFYKLTIYVKHKRN